MARNCMAHEQLYPIKSLNRVHDITRNKRYKIFAIRTEFSRSEQYVNQLFIESLEATLLFGTEMSARTVWP
jgi:hypothetical protein